jgi:TrmH family RNA methyltransferase
MNRLLISAKNAEFQIIQSLKTNREKRHKSREIFIEGIECVKQAMNANIEITRILTKGVRDLSDWGKNTVKKCENAKIIEMSKELYDTLSGKENPPELLVTAKMPADSLGNINAENPFILLFDRPSDHGNLGSMIRSANAFGVDGLFVMGHGIDIYEPKVIRASLGSVFFTKIINVESMETLKEYINKQKQKNNMRIMGTDSTGSIPITQGKLSRPVMVIMGNEAKGMSRGLKELCDEIVRIPIEGNVNSLNVSCAASIILWEIYKNKFQGTVEN